MLCRDRASCVGKMQGQVEQQLAMVLRDCLPSEVAMRILQADYGSHISRCVLLLTSGSGVIGPDLGVIPGALLHLQISRTPQYEAQQLKYAMVIQAGTEEGFAAGW